MQSTSQNNEGEDIQNNFVIYLIWVWHTVSYVNKGIWITSVWKWSAQENIWTYQGREMSGVGYYINEELCDYEVTYYCYDSEI